MLRRIYRKKMANLKGDGKLILTVFIGAIIAVVLLSAAADPIVKATTTGEVINVTVTMPSVGNGTVELEGKKLIAAGDIINATAPSNKTLDAGNASLVTLELNGKLTVALVANDSSAHFGETVNVTYTMQPDSYITTSGARSITTLIIIIGALAIVIAIIAILLFPGSSFSQLLKFGVRS